MTTFFIAPRWFSLRSWFSLQGGRRLAFGVLALLALTQLVGCVHRIDIQQGNFLDADAVDRVSVGMTRLQVRSLLGTPMVADPFQNSRWDYVYYLKKGRLKKPEQRHFIVFFDGADKVARIEHPDQTARKAQTS